MQQKTERQRELREAETKAEELFFEIEKLGFVQAGKSERELNDEIYELAFEMFGIRKYWHKRIVRAGENTLCPYKENPPDLVIAKDDILFFDFGPVFDEWEADYGRTYVLGSDEKKLKLKSDIESCWAIGKEYFESQPGITGAELFAFVSNLAQERGWEYGQEHCGHLIGNFPHERIQGDETLNYIHPSNPVPMRNPDKNGELRDWILEVHFVDRDRKIGGFFEQLLTVPA
jgi:Xaa-Pro aminopeptidase